ncbi:hypothetical protein K504DRAFT_451926 [Pleomassaria siparia CBS 279.74]|uniref:Uncharacterized protein n=1 Tax=Pleomassaria siparia CBS 279.74 TaxID=1314801 RepID=A0A6G1JSF2_9PLEO|nr:hypothetical protein K504DRAFT_451926 [Pleomassaria siparia CBS 279.74]
MPVNGFPNYPFCLPSYIAAFDGQLAQQELKAETRSWRSEGYAEDSEVLIFDHHHGVGLRRRCNDDDIDQLLVEPLPQVKFILLLPIVHEKVATDILARGPAAAKVFRRNELYDEQAGDSAHSEKPSVWIGDQFNISRIALFKILTRGVLTKCFRILDILSTNLFSPADPGSSDGHGQEIPSQFRASPEWWISLTTIIPLTGLAFLIWFIWSSRAESIIRQRIADEEVKVEVNMRLQKDAVA